VKKLFLILFIIVPVPVFAESIYYTYGNAPMIHGAFNAIALMFNSSSFARAVEVIFVLSFAVSVYMSVFSRRFEFLKYMFLSIFILTFFFWDRTNLVIEDVTLDQTYVVDDVPYGYAIVGELISGFGHFVTDFTDTAFSVPTTEILFGRNNAIPAELSFSKVGFAGPYKSMRSLSSFEIQDAELKSDINEYVSKCLVWDAMGLTNDEMKTLMNNDNIMQNKLFPKGFRSRYDVPVNIGGTSTTCSMYYPTYLETRIADHTNNLISNLYSETKLNPYMDSLSQSLAFFTNKSYDTYNAMVQSALIKTTVKGLANGTFANNRDAYSQFMAEMGIEQYQQKGNILARFGMQVMPIFKNVMEVLMIGVLPIILFFFILPNGWRLVSNYFQSLIWIQLWNPILSIINYVLVMAGVWQSQIANQMSGISDQGLTIGNFAYYTDFIDSYVAVAGYLMLSMPALATVVLMGGRWATGALAHGIAMSAYGAAAQGASPQGMEQIQRQGAMSEQMVRWNESGVDTIGMQMNRQTGFGQQYMQEASQARATTRAMGEMGYAGSQGQQKFFNWQSEVNQAQSMQDLNSQEMTMDGMSSGGGMWGGVLPAAQARSMGNVANMTAELESPQSTLDSMREARSTLSTYEAEAARQGNYQLAAKYDRMGDMLNSQISKYDANQDGKVDSDMVQEMKNDIATFNQTRSSTESLGFMQGAEEFENPNAQAMLMASMQSSGGLRQTLETSAEYASKDYQDSINIGSANAAETKAKADAMLDKWGSYDNIEKAKYSAGILAESKLAGQIEGWDTDDNGKIDSPEAKQGVQRFAAMSTYMDKSEAQQFWNTFEDDPNKAMQALNMKYGQRYKADKQFAEIAKERDLSAERLGNIMANEEIFQKEYTEGKNMVLQGMARELGMGEGALRGSDPKTNAIMSYAGELYDRVKSGEMTQNEAVQSLKNLGSGRASGMVIAGNRGDYAALSGRSSVSELTHDGDGYGFWDQTKDVAQDTWNYVPESIRNPAESAYNTYMEKTGDLWNDTKGYWGDKLDSWFDNGNEKKSYNFTTNDKQTISDLPKDFNPPWSK